MLILLSVLFVAVMNIENIVYATNTFTETSSVTSITTLEDTNATNENSAAEYYVALLGFLIIVVFVLNAWYTKEHSSTSSHHQ